MPQYIYQHPVTEEVKEIIQTMKEVHEYTDEAGTKWNRIYTVPAGVVDGKMDAFSQSKFVEKTGNMKGGTIGDIWDMSKELSEKREKVVGKDPVKAQAFKDYSKKRLGRKHQSDTSTP